VVAVAGGLQGLLDLHGVSRSRPAGIVQPR
jgi:hypothetical protein